MRVGVAAQLIVPPLPTAPNPQQGMGRHFVLVGTRSLTPPPRTPDRRRQRGDTYSAATRHLANRFFGILYHGLQKGIGYDVSGSRSRPQL
ncbi:MAG: hypothetical protein ACRDTH_13400 [Pseudonocardiaceae bacterium]